MSGAAQTFDWLESLPPQRCEAAAAALTRLGRVLKRGLTLGRTPTNSNFTVARFRPTQRRYSLGAGPERSLDDLRKARVPEE